MVRSEVVAGVVGVRSLGVPGGREFAAIEKGNA